MSQSATQTQKTVSVSDLSKALCLPLAAFLEQALGLQPTKEVLKNFHEKTIECLEEGLFEGLVSDFDGLQNAPDGTVADLGEMLGLFGDDEEDPTEKIELKTNR